MRPFLISVGLAFLFVLVVLPFGAVFYEAFRSGLGPYLQALGDPDLQFSVMFTVIVTAISVPITAAFGVFAAWLLATFRFPGRGFLLALLDLPFSLSPVLVGLLFVLLYGAQGVFGPALLAAGIRIVFSWPAVFLVTMFIVLPFIVKEVLPTLEERGTSEEEAAVTLGARGWSVFFRVTFPAIRPALLYGVVLASARAAGEFGAVNIVSGLIRGQTATLPLQIEIFYNDFATTAAFAGATLFVVFGVVNLFLQSVLKPHGGRS